MTLVAVYGTLREGCGNHYLIDAQPITTETLRGWKMYSLGGFPGCKKTDNEEDSIIIETYDVDSNTLANLDRLEGYSEGGYNTFYNRVSVESSVGDVYIYEYIPSVDNLREVENGDWVESPRQYLW